MKNYGEVILLSILVLLGFTFFFVNKPMLQYSRVEDLKMPKIESIENIERISPSMARHYLANSQVYSEETTERLVEVAMGLSEEDKKRLEETEKACKDVKADCKETRALLSDEIKRRKTAEANEAKAKQVAKAEADAEKKKSSMISFVITLFTIGVVAHMRFKKWIIDDLPAHIKAADKWVLISEIGAAVVLLFTQAFV